GGSERDERRPQQFFPEMIDLGRRAGECVLLIERDAVRDRQPAADVLRRPPQTRQARRGEMLVPSPALLECFVLAARSAEPFELGEFADQVVREPLAYLGPEFLDLFHIL